jgi:hypothetical protein
MAPKPRVLLAARPAAREPFRKALGMDAEFVEVDTLDAAVSELTCRQPFALVCCTVYFDESRMFDLLRWIKAQCSHIPVICARALPKDITRISMEAVSIAAHTLGAAEFVDLPTLAAEHGDSGASDRLRSILLGTILG